MQKISVLKNFSYVLCIVILGRWRNTTFGEVVYLDRIIKRAFLRSRDNISLLRNNWQKVVTKRNVLRSWWVYPNVLSGWTRNYSLRQIRLMSKTFQTRGFGKINLLCELVFYKFESTHFCNIMWLVVANWQICIVWWLHELLTIC